MVAVAPLSVLLSVVVTLSVDALSESIASLLSFLFRDTDVEAEVVSVSVEVAVVVEDVAAAVSEEVCVVVLLLELRR